MAVNQKQIAERLGISIAVVSRSLSGTAREIGIAEETIERVKAAALEMGYVPNAAARALKGKASNTIGVVVYDFLDPFFGAMLEQLQQATHERGYSLILVGFQGRHPTGADLTPLRKHTINGLVVLGSADGTDWLADFKHLPVVRIGHGDTMDHGVCVTIDEEAAAGELLDHLASIGVRQGRFIGSKLYVHELRYAAFERMAMVRGMQIEKVITHDRGFAAGKLTVEKLLAGNQEPTALVCATDIIAMGALHALHDAGRQSPVTGFDGIPAAAQFIPSITTIRQPVEHIVEQAVAAIMGAETPSERLLAGQLIVRNSTLAVVGAPAVNKIPCRA